MVTIPYLFLLTYDLFQLYKEYFSMIVKIYVLIFSLDEIANHVFMSYDKKDSEKYITV
jgi:hypothetical protein